MTTDWIRKHVRPSLIAKYEKEMSKLRGEESHLGHIVENIKKLNDESDRIESEADRRARLIAEDEEDMKYYKDQKSKGDLS
jgi:uncharacterized protein YdcH (DUF465 family)